MAGYESCYHLSLSHNVYSSTKWTKPSQVYVTRLCVVNWGEFRNNIGQAGGGHRHSQFNSFPMVLLTIHPSEDTGARGQHHSGQGNRECTSSCSRVQNHNIIAECRKWRDERSGCVFHYAAK